MSDAAAKFDAKMMAGQIEERLNAAFPGKWKVDGYRGNYKVAVGDLDVCTCWAGESDAEFIAHAPEDIRWLLQEIEDLHEKIQEESDGS